MIEIPEGWRRITSVGSDVVANPARTVQARYTSHITPLVPFAATVAAAMAAMPEWRTTAQDARHRVVTAEGEYAYGALLTGTWLGEPAQRYLGVVYGDDAMSLLDVLDVSGGVGLGGGRAGTVEAQARELLGSVTLRLGVRPRRYFYLRPEGWHGHATGLVTHWFPAAFPARPATIVVYPAAPTHEEPFTVYDALVRHERAQGARVEIAAPTQPITARDGLAGSHWSIACHSPGRVVHRDLVVLGRAPHTYALQLDAYRTVDAGARAAFLALARSVEPLPVGGMAAPVPAADAGGFAHFL